MGDKEGFHRPLQSGILIKGRTGTHPDYVFGQGTLTGLATRSGAKVLVTNMHVMAGLSADDNLRNPTGSEQMYQGGNATSFKVGDIIDWQRLPANENEYMEIDAAVCDLDPSSASRLGALYKLHDEPHGTRFIITGTKEPVKRLPIVLLGAKTGEIPGTIDQANIEHEFAGEDFRNLFTISLDSDTTIGNSGSPILYKVETGVYQMVGIHMGNYQGNRRKSLACRASAVQRILNVKFGHREPKADAGSDQTVLPNTVVTLDGSGSKVYDGDAKYQWEQEYAGVSTDPNPTFHRVTITNPTGKRASFTMPENEQALLFKLTVTDSYGLTSTDRIFINLNRKPVANAGPDQQVARGVRVHLKGSAQDPDKQHLTQEWTKISGPDVTLHNSKTLTPYFDAPNESAIFAWRLTVKDSLKVEHSDYVIVFVDYKPDERWRDWLPVVPPQYRGSGASRERLYRRDGVYLLPPIDREGNPVSDSARIPSRRPVDITPHSIARQAVSITARMALGLALRMARLGVGNRAYIPVVLDPFNPGAPQTQYDWRPDPELEVWGRYERTGEYEGCGPNRKAEERRTSDRGNTETRLVPDPEEERWGPWADTSEYQGCGPDRERKQKSISHCGNTKFKWVSAPEPERWGPWANTSDYQGCGPDRERKQKSTSHCGNTKFKWVSAPEPERWGPWANTSDYQGCGPDRERKQKSTSHCGNTKFKWVSAPEPERWRRWIDTGKTRGATPCVQEKEQKSTSHCGNTKFQWVRDPQPETWGDWKDTLDRRISPDDELIRQRKETRTSNCGNTETRWVYHETLDQSPVWSVWKDTGKTKGSLAARKKEQKRTSDQGETQTRWVSAPEPKTWGAWQNTSTYQGSLGNRRRRQKRTSNYGNVEYRWVSAPEPKTWGAWQNTSTYQGSLGNRQRRQKRTSNYGNVEYRWVSAPEPETWGRWIDTGESRENPDTFITEYEQKRTSNYGNVEYRWSE